MKAIAVLTLVVFGLVAVVNFPVQAGWDPGKEKKERKKVDETIQTFNKKDLSIKTFLNKAYGYVVFPSIAKGGMSIGGAHGEGLVFKKGIVIGRASLSQGAIGFQIGGQVYSEIIFFENSAALKHFTDGSFAFDAQASAVAANAGVSANVDYKKNVAVFTLAKGGLMYEASIGGQKCKFKPKK